MDTDRHQVTRICLKNSGTCCSRTYCTVHQRTHGLNPRDGSVPTPMGAQNLWGSLSPPVREEDQVQAMEHLPKTLCRRVLRNPDTPRELTTNLIFVAFFFVDWARFLEVSSVDYNSEDWGLFALFQIPRCLHLHASKWGWAWTERRRHRARDGEVRRRLVRGHVGKNKRVWYFPGKLCTASLRWDYLCGILPSLHILEYVTMETNFWVAKTCAFIRISLMAKIDHGISCIAGFRFWLLQRAIFGNKAAMQGRWDNAFKLSVKLPGNQMYVLTDGELL